MQNRFSPLRYPGGKAKLSAYVENIFDINELNDGHYVEPYAGGAGVALALMFSERASHIHINDINLGVYAFWHSVLYETEELSKKIADTVVSIEQWAIQKSIMKNAHEATLLEIGFAMFFLNRTNRSGIINAGVIGGQKQDGNWKIDARYNKLELLERIEHIAEYRDRISLYNLDACKLIESIAPKLPSKSLIYFDPPYYMKGNSLYENHYKPEDHQAIFDMIKSNVNTHWIVSYDNVAPIREIYAGMRQLIYDIGYSARDVYNGSEVIIFSQGLAIPTTQNPLKLAS
jgi:DNA adenine methylase